MLEKISNIWLVVKFDWLTQQSICCFSGSVCHLLLQDEIGYSCWKKRKIVLSREMMLPSNDPRKEVCTGREAEVTVSGAQTCSSGSQTETTAHRKLCLKGDREEISWREVRTVKSFLKFRPKTSLKTTACTTVLEKLIIQKFTGPNE